MHLYVYRYLKKGKQKPAGKQVKESKLPAMTAVKKSSGWRRGGRRGRGKKKKRDGSRAGSFAKAD